MQLEETSTDSGRVRELEQKLKEKEILTEKLRHQGPSDFSPLILSNPIHIHPACSRHYQRALARGAPPPAQVLVRHERRPPPGHQCRPAVHHDASRRQQTIRDARTARNHPRVDRPRTRARGITAHGRRRAATCDRTPLAQRPGRSRPRGKGRAGENR
jgi:hypothetical protein